MIVLQIIAVIAGVSAVLFALRSAIQTFILPRAVSDPTARAVFLAVRGVFDLRAWRAASYEARDALMALYAPIALGALLVSWLVIIVLGYTLIYWGLGVGSLQRAFLISGSSLFTLGFAAPALVGQSIVVFSQAGIGLLLAALLVAYMPTIYGAWSRREHQVATLEVRAGSPPTSWGLIIRYHRIAGIEADELWPAWEDWFVDVEESHTSLASLVFFRSPQPDRSWVNAAGVVLDSAALLTSSVEVERNPRRELCLRAGYIALRRIAQLFKLPFDPDPKPGDPISVSRYEFDDAWEAMADAGVPMKPDRDQAWSDFAGWRVNYDQPLLRLAALTMAPYAPWISDRSIIYRHPFVSFWRRRFRPTAHE